MPRPTALTPELAHSLYDLIRHGAALKAACKASGITYETFRTWRLPCTNASPEHAHVARCLHTIETMKWEGNRLVGSGQFKAFSALIDGALGEHETRLALLFTRAAETDWRAAEAMLRRRYPENWSAVGKVEVSESGCAPLEMGAARERLLVQIHETRLRLQGSENLDRLVPGKPA